MKKIISLVLLVAFVFVAGAATGAIVVKETRVFDLAAIEKQINTGDFSKTVVIRDMANKAIFAHYNRADVEAQTLHKNLSHESRVKLQKVDAYIANHDEGGINPFP